MRERVLLRVPVLGEHGSVRREITWPKTCAAAALGGRRGRAARERSAAEVELHVGATKQAATPPSSYLDGKRRIPRGSDPIHN